MKYWYLIICIALLISCHSKITKIEMAKSGAWSYRGGAISINNSYEYNYFESLDGQAPSNYIGRIDTKFWDTLTRKIEDIDFTKIHSDEQGAADISYYELIIHRGDEKVRIVKIGVFNKDSLSNLIGWLNQSSSKVKLTKVSRHFKFETTFQNPPDLKAMGINIETMRFLPPVEKKISRKGITN